MKTTAPTHVHATILYTGVHDGSRQYPDYGAIDRSILEGDAPRR